MAVVTFQTFAERNDKLGKLTGIITQMKALNGRALGHHDFLRSFGLLTGTEFAEAYDDIDQHLSAGEDITKRLAYVDGSGNLAGLVSKISPSSTGSPEPLEWHSFYPSPIKCGLSPAGGSAVFSNVWNPAAPAYDVTVDYPTVWNTYSKYAPAHVWSGRTASMIVFRKPPIGADKNKNHQVSPLSMLRCGDITAIPSTGDTFDITGATTPQLIGEVSGDGAYTVTEVLAVTDANDPANIGPDEHIWMCGLRFEPALPLVAFAAEDTGMQISVRTGEMPRPAITWSTAVSFTGYIVGKV